ncbi:hypothetical protein LG289_17685 (plasmid) [Planococcus rifietoensis]
MMVALTTSPFETDIPDIIYARISRSFVSSMSKNEISITPTAFSMMFAISPYVDVDREIKLHKYQIKQLLRISQSSFNHTLQVAKNAGIIEEKRGKLFSNVHTFEKSNKLTFIPNYERLVDGNFPKLGRWATRLFSYVLSSRIENAPLRVNIENLYDNTLHTAENGLVYMKSAKNVVATLIECLKADVIELKIPSRDDNKKLVSINKLNVEEHTALLEEHVEIMNSSSLEGDSPSKKKVRTSMRKVENDTHILYIYLAKSVTAKTMNVKASHTEIDNILKENAYESSFLKSNTVNGIIGIKNDLFKAANLVGLAIYKKSLIDYCKEKMPIIDVHDSQEFALQDHLMNYYVLVSIRKILLKAAEDISSASKAGMDLPNTFKTAFGSLTFIEVKKLLEYYNTKSSINHKVVFEKELLDLGINQNDLPSEETGWNPIFDETSHVHLSILSHFEQGLTRPELRDIAFELAERTLLVQKEKYEKYLKDLASKRSASVKVENQLPYVETPKGAGNRVDYDKKYHFNMFREILEQ